MRLTLVDSPRHIATLPKFQHVVLRVISGAAVIGRDRQSLENGDGLPIAVSDGIQNLAWDTGALFMAASPLGSQCEIEVIVPS